MNDRRIMGIAKTFELPTFRQHQLRDAFFRHHIDDFSSITTLPKPLRTILADDLPVLTVSPVATRTSRANDAIKALLRLRDGRQIETVLISPKPGLWSCCISSQAGCALHCTFCATGTLGLQRHLTSEEIVDQVLFWRFYMTKNRMTPLVRNVVYMGMGEPFHNKTAVLESLDELMNPRTFNMGARHISVSTAGMTPVIEEFAERYPQVNLAVSLHAPNDELRMQLMPVNKKYGLSGLVDAMRAYVVKTNRKLFIEYVLLRGINDAVEQVDQLIRLLSRIDKRHLIHVNLIVYNPTAANYRESSSGIAREFRNRLRNTGFSATIRKNLGRDISGACGQLALSPGVEAVT